MELTLERVIQLRDEGLSWRQLGLFLADEFDEDPYRMQERARNMWRSHKETVIRRSRRINKDESNVSEIQMLKASPTLLDNDGLLQKHGYDPMYWRVIDSSCALRGEVWTSRLKVTARKVPQLDKEEFTQFLKYAVQSLPKHTPVERTLTQGESILVMGLFDIHYGREGLKADHTDTKTHVESITYQLLERIKDLRPEKIIIPVGQDFLNADTISGTTTGGTPQDNSLSWHEMISGGIALIMWIIETLEPYADIEVVYSEGNHDRVLSYAIIKALEARYYDSPTVTVDSEPDPRKYIEYGHTLIGLSHGKYENSLSTVMQVEVPEKWGRTKSRYWMLGHLHHLQMLEKDGVTIMRCPSIAFADDWTHRKGYVGSDRAMASVVYSKEGLEDIWVMRP